MKKIFNKMSSRMRRAFFLKGMLHLIHGASMKWADTTQELERSFRLVYDEYLKLGYIKEPNSSNIFFNIYSLLPNSDTMVMKSNDEVISTLSMVRDDEHFGLPMDEVYHDDLNKLRKQGRKLCEFCSLASSGEFEHRNLFMYLFRSMYLNAVDTGINDICIMVNPRHVAFYKTILFFEELGTKKTYVRINQPAVALRLNLDMSEQKMKEAYEDCEPEYSLYHFVYEQPRNYLINQDLLLRSKELRRITAQDVLYFLKKETNILQALLPSQKASIAHKYPALRHMVFALEYRA